MNGNQYYLDVLDKYILSKLNKDFQNEIPNSVIFQLAEDYVNIYKDFREEINTQFDDLYKDVFYNFPYLEENLNSKFVNMGDYIYIAFSLDNILYSIQVNFPCLLDLDSYNHNFHLEIKSNSTYNKIKFIEEKCKEAGITFCNTNIEDTIMEICSIFEIIEDIICQEKEYELLIPFFDCDQTERNGYKDNKGKIVIAPKYIYASYFCENLASISVDGFKNGYINYAGEEVIPCQFDTACNFCEHVASVENNGKWGVIDIFGNIVIPIQYDKICNCHNGIIIAKKSGYWGALDKQNNTLIPFEYDGILDFNEGIALAIKKGKAGYIDIYNNVIIPFMYDKCLCDHSENMFAVRQDGKFGFLDNKGNIIIPFLYEVVGNFNEGYCAVRVSNKYFFIDRFGRKVTQSYEDVSYFSFGIAGVKKDGKWGYINTKGNLIVPFIYDDVDPVVFGYARVKKGDKYGFIDSEGNIIIEPKYEYAMYYKNSYFMVKINNEEFFIYKDGVRI